MKNFNLLRVVLFSVIVFSLALIGFLSGKKDNIERDTIYYIGFIAGFTFASIVIGLLLEFAITFFKK